MRDIFRKVNVGIIDLFKHKPINKSFIKKIAKYKKIFFSIEEHNQNGGIGDIISSIITSKKLKINLYKMSLKDNSTFDYGSRNYLLRKNNLEKDQILKFIKHNLGKMKYKFKLSNISKLGLGCWGLGGDSYGKLNEQRAIQLIKFAVKKKNKFF